MFIYIIRVFIVRVWVKVDVLREKGQLNLKKYFSVSVEWMINEWLGWLGMRSKWGIGELSFNDSMGSGVFEGVEFDGGVGFDEWVEFDEGVGVEGSDDIMDCESWWIVSVWGCCFCCWNEIKLSSSLANCIFTGILVFDGSLVREEYVGVTS